MTNVISIWGFATSTLGLFLSKNSHQHYHGSNDKAKTPWTWATHQNSDLCWKQGELFFCPSTLIQAPLPSPVNVFHPAFHGTPPGSSGSVSLEDWTLSHPGSIIYEQGPSPPWASVYLHWTLEQSIRASSRGMWWGYNEKSIVCGLAPVGLINDGIKKAIHNEDVGLEPLFWPIWTD